MNEAILEIVEFRPSGDVEALYEGARKMEPWLRAQPGFRWRRLSRLDDGTLIDTIEWSDMASAKAAADQIMTAEQVAGFMAMIDGSSVAMRHARIAVSQ
ncbi:MAG: hypothetical protein O9972_09140 [Burkholderiales bacterium]|nr:hypothetical protein [Burkholderiales bacterium]